jgi:hypothetical protein
MIRRILRICTIGCALLVVAVVALWIRGYWFIDGVRLQTKPHLAWSIMSGGGSFVVGNEDEGRLSTEFLSLPVPPEYRHFWVWRLGYEVRSWGHWVVIGYPYIVGMLAGLIAALRMAHRRVHRAGLCARCGYDLRATPERCPECGEAVR